jgi:hypothetical protein
MEEEEEAAALDAEEVVEEEEEEGPLKPTSFDLPHQWGMGTIGAAVQVQHWID